MYWRNLHLTIIYAFFLPSKARKTVRSSLLSKGQPAAQHSIFTIQPPFHPLYHTPFKSPSPPESAQGCKKGVLAPIPSAIPLPAKKIASIITLPASIISTLHPRPHTTLPFLAGRSAAARAKKKGVLPRLERGASRKLLR